MPARLLLLAAVLALCAALSGCAGRLSARPERAVPAVLSPAATAGVADGRARFREVFTAVLAARGGGDAVKLLWRLSGEGDPTGRPVDLAPSRAGLTLVMVPGLLGECVADTVPVFGDARDNLEAQGYGVAWVRTAGRHGCEHNAALIRDAVLALPEGARAVLVTHSKGAPDTLTALVEHPEIVPRVAAVVAVSGAVNGSPLAEAFPEFLLRLAEKLPLSQCQPGPPGEAVGCLRRAVRLAWLAAHPLPASVRYYSLPSFALPENTSLALRPFFSRLASTDPLNDGLVLCSDAVIPGSTLLGYPNADHLAVAMPMQNIPGPLPAALFNRNAYPRAALAEAVARFVEEDLHAHAP